MRILSQFFVGRGNKKYRLGELEGATKEYEMAARLASGWSVPWFCLGMIHKQRLNWIDSLRCSVRAVALDPTSEGAWWNSGIAATALEDWRVARGLEKVRDRRPRRRWGRRDEAWPSSHSDQREDGWRGCLV